MDDRATPYDYYYDELVVMSEDREDYNHPEELTNDVMDDLRETMEASAYMLYLYKDFKAGKLTLQETFDMIEEYEETYGVGLIE